MSNLKQFFSKESWRYFPHLIVIFFIVFCFIYFISTPYLKDNQLIGVILGSLISIYTSLLIYWQQRLDKLKPISRGFLIEIECYKPFIEEWLAAYKKANLKSRILFTIFDFNRPFYTEESLFHIFRKELYEFDSDLSHKIFEFFSLVRGAEESRRFIVDHIEDHFHPLRQEASMMHIKTNLTRALEIIPEIEIILKELDNQ